MVIQFSLLFFLSHFSAGKKSWKNMSVGLNGDIRWINENQELSEFLIRM